MTRRKRHKTGKASRYIKHFKKLLKSRLIIYVVLYCRESRCWQEKNGNLENQVRYLLRRIRRYEKKYHVKIQIVGIFREVASGWKDDRPILVQASRVAKAMGAVLLAESSCRLLRHKSFHSNQNPDVLPTVYDYETLIEATDGVTLATIMPPNTPWRKVRGYHTKRGQKTKRSKGGRPRKNVPGYKKQEREEKLPVVLRMHKERRTPRDIAYKTGLKVDRVRAWIGAYGG